MSNAQAPLTAAMFNVLLALSDGDKHGYAILKEVEQQTAGEVQLSTGTLYGIIKRLLIDGLICELRTRPAANDDQIKIASLDLSAAIRPYRGPIDTTQSFVKTIAYEAADHVP